MAGKLGMGLLETLLENLDRDLNLANTTLTNPVITTSAAVTTSGVRNHDSLIPKRVTKFDLGAQVSLDPQSDGTAFSGATGEINQWGFRCGNTLAVHAIGTQTLLAPALNAAGLDVSGDQLNNDGWSIRGRSASALGALNKDNFIVGTSAAFYFKVKFSIADVSGIDDLRCGFAKVEAHNADPDGLDELAAMHVVSGDIKTTTIINNASTVTTDLTNPSSGDWADGATHTFKILVSAAGVVTYELDDTAPTGAVRRGCNSILVPPT